MIFGIHPICNNFLRCCLSPCCILSGCFIGNSKFIENCKAAGTVRACNSCKSKCKKSIVKAPKAQFTILFKVQLAAILQAL